MRINNNIMAMNANRQLGINNSNVSNSTEKLSSGYRINRAGDDAAGLAISEKMRAQIRGLQMASKNSQDAISLVQTAEGALQEVHSMLQRMSELATQSATGTNEGVDREAISAEFEALKSEIDDIANQTNFNNMKLLNGSFNSSKVNVSSTSDLKVKGNITDATTGAAYSIFENVGMSASKAGEFEIKVGTYAADGTFTQANVSDPTELAGATHLQVSFKDSTTNNVTNTIISIKDALDGTIADNSSFSLNLSAAGLGSYAIVGHDEDNTAEVTKSSFLAALDGKKVITTTAATTDGTSATAVTSAALSTTATFGSTETNATYGWTGVDAAALTSFLENEGYTLTDGDVTATLDFSGTNIALKIGGDTFDTGVAVPTLAVADGDTDTIDLSAAGLGTVTVSASGATLDDGDVKADLSAQELNFTVATNTTPGTPSTSTASNAMKVQVGASQGEQLEIAIDKMDSTSLGLTNATISVQEDAGKAITLVRTAINTVSSQRASLGALQNRLQHKINNLDTSAENLAAAESRIRDLDMATEMTSFTKNQILVQASTAMLAQANAAPQAVLKLLG